MALPRLFVAIDTPDEPRAAALARAIGPAAGIKLGLEFFVANGPAGVERVRGPGQALFLDLKFHDIPNTVAGAVRSALAVAPDLLTLHAGGGAAMMTAAREAAEAGVGAGTRPRLIALTILTSLAETDLAATGQQGPLAAQVLRLAKLAQSARLDGVVCSGHEIAPLRAALGHDFRLVVPGLRPAGAAPGDQSRVMTPGAAARLGADWLVIGRPVTQAGDPAAALAHVVNEIAEASP